MALRKAAAYSKKRVRAYTRKSNVKKKSYIKTIPPQKIVKFKMGAVGDYNKGKLKQLIKVISKEKVLIRDNALEACRQFIHRNLDKIMSGQYFFEVRVFPHHILRENKMLTGAGADRMQSGMQRSFGSIAGRAAIVKPNQELFLIAVFNEKARKDAVEVIGKIKSKLPCSSRIVIEKKE